MKSCPLSCVDSDTVDLSPKCGWALSNLFLMTYVQYPQEYRWETGRAEFKACLSFTGYTILLKLLKRFE